MREYIAFDSHKHYTLAEREPVDARKGGGRAVQERIEHERGAIRKWLSACPAGSTVAVEAVGNWYWIADEIEQAGMKVALVHPRKAKLMMGMINKTDKLDVHGLNRLQRNGTLPTVWVPPATLRDLRELTRCRVMLTRQRTCLKNRVHAILEKHLAAPRGVSDVFGRGGRRAVEASIKDLPPQTGWVVQIHLDHLDFLEAQIHAQEERLKALVKVTGPMRRLMSLPGVAVILSGTIALEVGEVGRFADAEHLAAYAGTTPRVHSSGGKARYGRTRPDVNRYLKWAFAEAANSVVVNHRRRPDKHVSRLYVRLRARRGHACAVGAVARRLAEASWEVLSRDEDYREPR